jgi:hypothetical protein
MEARWEDTDDFARFAIDVKGLAQDGRRATKPFLPITVAEDDGVGRAGRIVLTGEQSAEDGGNAEKRESAVGDVKGVDLFRLGAASDANGIAIVNTDVLKGAILFAIDEVIGGSDVEILDVDAGGGEPDADKLVRTRIGKRLEENAFENAEDDGVATDAGGERDESNDGEKRGTPETAKDLFQVEQERSHLRGLRWAVPRIQRDGRQSLIK